MSCLSSTHLHLVNCILTNVMSEQHSFRIQKNKCATASLQMSLPPTPCQLHAYKCHCHLHLVNCILTNVMTEQHFECFVLRCFALLCFALLCFAMLCFALLCLAMLCIALLCLLALHALLAMSEQHSHHLANCILTIVMSEQHSFRILTQKCTTVICIFV